jgi:chromosome segregation ATPase
MYGDTEVMRRRAGQLREQGVDLRALADRLVAQTEGVGWTGRAGDALRERIRDRAAELNRAAARHEAAAESLERHLHEVDRLKEQIAEAEEQAAGLDPTTFAAPPPGHRGWLRAALPEPSRSDVP